MYTIIRRQSGSFLALCRIQDGTERKECGTLEEAQQWLISSARLLNGSYIRTDDIEINSEPPKEPMVLSPDEVLLIEQVRRREVIPLPFNDKRIRYRLTDEECDLIVQIREGEASVHPRST